MRFHVPTVLAFFGAWASVVAPLGGLSLWLADRQHHATQAVERRLQEQIRQVEGGLRAEIQQVEGRLSTEVRETRDSVTALGFRLSRVEEDVAFIKGYLRMTRAPDGSGATEDDR